MRIISMNKTANLLYVCVMILRCVWHFHNVYAKQRIPVSLNYKGKYTSDIKNFEIVFPQRVTKDGNFISHLVQHHHSKRSTNEMQYIFYKIPIGGKDYLIELTPNKELISPGAVVEIRKEGVRKSSKREFLNENNPNETLRQMFENLEIKKLKNTECHFSGHVKGENTSKAALSTCYGLAGFIQIEQGFYTIEPVAGRDPFVENSYPHILYQEDGLENSSTCHTIREMAKALVDKVIRKRRESSFGSSVPMFAETLIVMDKTMVNHHRDLDCENYVLTVFNMAFNLFRDVSLGMLMTLTIVRIIRLETEDDHMNLKLDENAEKTLKHFQTWQYEINPGDDTHPNHHDIALLLTRVNVCYSPTSCGILGLTTIGKACDPKQSAALCEDSGLRLGYVIAHEIGHLLGADHDTANSTCKGTSKNGLRTVMHPHVSLTSKTWSKCSQAYFRKFFKTVENCFLDEPEEHQFNGQDLLPGVMYNANFQCKYLFASNSRECEIGSTCTSLNCHIPGYACIVTHTPPADGTRCGESMWCHNSKCLVVGERPGAVDGNWGEWSAWSDCTRTCGSGVASSMRNCDKPQPAHGGKNCADLIRLISEEVNVSFVGKPCETGRPSFRDIQCGEFNDWIYPEDGKIHSWKAHYFHEDNPCVLYCINEDKEVAALRPRVVDGTMCYRGFRDLCIAGSCKSLPCDLQFGSNAVEDACGVCHGDGTGCEFSQGVQTLPKLKRGLTKLVNIPVGTKNINVEEMSPTSAKIVVRDKDTKDIYVRGKSLGIFNVPGSQAWLGMIKKDQEALRIPGPVSKPLSIWIHRLENVTVKWSMALPAEQQRKPAFVWDFLKWGPCSAECGPGTQKSEPSCVEEKAGLVEDIFCADLQTPAAKVRPCEIAKCIPRWMVGDWKSCYMSRSQEKEKKRAVYCIKKVGEGEGETEIVPDSQCKDPKPHSVEPCENRKKREDSDYNYLTEEAIYSTDTSDNEFAFHKKYDNDYSKHFVVIPQKKSETVLFMSFPHFRHFIHIPEAPEDSETDSMENNDLNKYLIDNITSRLQNKVSSDFHKNMFSRHQTDISHLINKEGLLIENSKEGKKITKQKVADKMIFIRPAKKGPNRQKRDKTRSISRRSNLYYRSSHCQTKFFAPKKNLLLPDSKAFENTQSNGSWKTYFITSQTESDPFSEVKTARKKTMQKKGRESMKKTNWKYSFYLPHMGRQKLMKREFFLKVFNRNSPGMKNKNGKTLKKLNFLKPVKRKFSQAEDRTPSLLGKKRKKFEKNRDKNLFLNSINDNFFRSADYRGRLRSKNSFFGEKNSEIYYKRNSNPIFTSRELNKTKRSNWKKKKLKPKETNPKSIKNSNEYSCNTETRNYLNNLFRENRKKATTQKPPEIVTYPVEEPVIQAGKIVIDRDSIEDKQMEILFLDEDTDERSDKCGQLPRPPVNEKRLSLRGQEVFDLIQKLQRRSCLYRQHNETEVQVRIPEDAPDKNEDMTPEAKKENDTPKITSTSQQETETTKTTIKKEKLTGVTESTQSRVLTTTKAEFTSKNGTVEEITIENSDKEDQYDIDEILPYPPNGSTKETTTEQTKRKKKKEKMKDKEKEKGKKKGPYLEDYQHELDEGEKNKTNTTPTSGYYDWRNLFKRKKRHRT